MQVFEPKWLVKVPRQGFEQLAFLHIVANLVNRPLEQQAVSSSDDAAAPVIHTWPARSHLSLVSVFAGPNLWSS